MPPTRWRPGSFRTALGAALLAATAPLLAACSHDAMLLESDVPVPSGMSTVRSADIRRSGGTVSGGRFILAGPVDDAGALMVATRERFAGSGWTTVEIKDGLDHSEGIFTKDARRARLTIDRRALEPDMSSGSLEIGPVDAGSAQGATPAATGAGNAEAGTKPAG
ncbi:MAG: hypothetical protein LW806_09265 [Planctomycetaceae bacterium]|jgi:hypothetical protein|nr:hypothetical protein [Planctomycetaceae bacterium]